MIERSKSHRRKELRNSPQYIPNAIRAARHTPLVAVAHRATDGRVGVFINALMRVTAPRCSLLCFLALSAFHLSHLALTLFQLLLQRAHLCHENFVVAGKLRDHRACLLRIHARSITTPEAAGDNEGQCERGCHLNLNVSPTMFLWGR